jgi:hypothetical protein
MQRRTFVSGLAAAGLINAHPSLAKAPASALDGGQALEDGHVGARRLLVPVWDPIATTADAPTPASDGGRTNLRPLLIGLGPAGEALVEQARHHPMRPPDAGLYRSLAAPADGAAGIDSARLARCRSALLLIDSADPQALADAVAWAQQLERHQVPMRLGVLVGTAASEASTPTRAALRRALTNLIEVRSRRATLEATRTVALLVPGLAFLHRGLVDVDADALRRLLASTASARAAAVRWQHEALLPAALANACLPLEPSGCRGVMAWLHAGHDISIGEFDAAKTGLAQRLPAGAETLLAVHVHPEWPERRRRIALVMAGDWED